MADSAERAGHESESTPGRPALTIVDGYTTAVTTARLDHMQAPCRCAAPFVKECERHAGGVFLVREDGSDRKADAKNVLEVIFLTITPGTPVRVMVEGTDAASERLVLRLVSALRCDNGEDLARFCQTSDREEGT